MLTLVAIEGTFVATQSPKPCCETEFLSRHRVEKSLSRPKPPSWPGNNVVTRRSLLRHRSRKLSCACILRCCLRMPSRTPRTGHAPGLRNMSQHKVSIPCRDRDLKMGNSPFRSSVPPVFPFFFSFLFFPSTLNSICISLFITKTIGNLENLPKFIHHSK